MITVSNLGMQFGGQWLFQHVDLQFLPGNCYGIIGANGAGKSTFLRILTGELDSTTGHIAIDPDKRVSVLKQNQNAYDEFSIMDTVIMGNAHLYEVMKEKDLAWIVARNKITIINPINVGKVVKVNTWPLPNGRFDFDREYLLYNEEGNLIAKGTSKWLVYNLKRNFLCSSKGIMEDIEFETKRNYEEKFEKINYGDLNDFNLVYEKKINFSDLDHYGHMNNAKYLVILVDSLNLNKDDLIEEIQVDYINKD
jgi:acyl-CoA thioesterase FadM